jgi:hypothetical protein
MATRSNIGKKLPDGSIRYIYCHFDGSENGVGATLKKHYLDEAKIDALLNLGSLSSLGAEIGEKHNFNQEPKGDLCRAYGRDRGEEDTEAVITTNMNEFMVLGIGYLYENNVWTSYNS